HTALSCCDCVLSLSRSASLRDLHSFPTRRSSDLSRVPSGPSLLDPRGTKAYNYVSFQWRHHRPRDLRLLRADAGKPSRAGTAVQDRKSTRLNSSHVKISYAVFCLKKKTKTKSLTV